ncbi:hypothetical protein MMC25_008113 [Agyrium rufum]|nr:hypothetical protein [Agyrium rufum]
MRQYLADPNARQPPHRGPQGKANSTSVSATSQRPPPAPTGITRSNTSTVPLRSGISGTSITGLRRPLAATAPRDPTANDLERVESDRRARSASLSRAASETSDGLQDWYEIQHGRRFLRGLSEAYPLPVDIDELHRQCVRTLMLMYVHGRPYCSPEPRSGPPKRILELACGSALWSSLCHESLKKRGCSDTFFTGADIAPLAPDLREQGVNWRFVQCDLRRKPWPFEDGEFDLILIKDASFAVPNTKLSGNPFSEPLRILRSGGAIECWESDFTIRTLLPHPSVPPGKSEEDAKQAYETATYLVCPSTPFAKPQDDYLQQYNRWVGSALEKRNFSAQPCALAAWSFTSDAGAFSKTDSRRVAIPFGSTRWEREASDLSKHVGTPPSLDRDISTIAADKKASGTVQSLTKAQLSIRQTALRTTVQFLEGIELLLREESGKQPDEWDRWWANMTSDLLDPERLFNGECLESGAWWGVKA